MKRKEFIKIAASAVAATTVSNHLVGCDSKSLRYSDEVLVIIKLQGGMDGYHFLAPRGNDLINKLRPNLIKPIQDKGINWKDDWYFHPKFSSLCELNQKGWLKIIPNVGFNDYHRLSHFKAMDYWETGSVFGDERKFRTGWVGRLVDDGTIRVIGNNNPILIMDRSENRFHIGDSTEGLTYIPHDPKSNFQAIIADWLDEKEHLKNSQFYQKVFNQYKIREELKNIKPIRTPEKHLKGKLEQVADCIEKNKPFAVYGLSHEGYDTHHKQIYRLESLAGDLFDGLNYFAKRLNKNGQWERVKVFVYTEFGRTIWENRTLGTGHGTANHAYILGGNLGSQWDEIDSSFSTIKLAGRDYVKHNTDFREVYKKIIPNQA